MNKNRSIELLRQANLLCNHLFIIWCRTETGAQDESRAFRIWKKSKDRSSRRLENFRRSRTR